ncbi:hypothetical protein PMG11_01384 [Penicillium brasilianum]|uniref:GPI anchored protein n=1 Tax=Penicillium brasilianum TaxID=104259 RepID=A0A0F7TEC5_PENBI|nr:hypothetical protein PMG11_01384 [Penicillium brasilianum]
MCIQLWISTLALLTLTNAKYLAAHAQITAGPQYHALHARQGTYTCDSGYTSCVGWGACCTSGAPCTVINGQRGCDAVCNGVEVCGHLCCDIGFQCSANSFCVTEGYGGESAETIVTTSIVESVVTSSSASVSVSEENGDGTYTILPYTSTTHAASNTPVSLASSSTIGSNSSAVGGSSSTGSSVGLSSSSGATTSPSSSATPVQTTGNSGVGTLERRLVMICMVVLFLGIAL